MDRIFHTWDKWECFPAGFYETNPPGDMTRDEAEEAYRQFLSNIPLFQSVLSRVVTEWGNSCEHYLTNERMNRIAWLGQASLAYHLHIPANCCGGYHRLTEDQQLAADTAALEALNQWLVSRGEEPRTLETVKSKTQANLY